MCAHLVMAIFLFLFNAPSVSTYSCTSSPSTYSNTTQTAFLPFLSDGTANGTFPIALSASNISVQTSYHSDVFQVPLVGIDTGSLGVAVSAATLSLQGDLENCTHPGFEYLSSSRRLWSGCWVDSSLYFTTATNAQVEAQVPILAVTETSTCTNWTGSACNNKTAIDPWPTNVHYMGVGFGRGGPEQPGATPDKNPLLNVVAVDGAEVDMHAGYIVTLTGVHVGLSAANTVGFQQTKLPLRPGTTAPKDWRMVGMEISIDGLPVDAGLALFDTGIPQAYVRVSSATYEQLDGAGAFCRQNTTVLLCSDIKVRVLVGDGETPIADYDVIVGAGDPIEPSGFRVNQPSSAGPFINTGRHFYYSFDAMLDGECGWFGLRGKSANTGRRTESNDASQQGHEL